MDDRSEAMKGETKHVVGWREWVGLPQLGIDHIKAKMDSGAKTCALHAYYVTQFERDGKPWVRFGMHPLQRDSLTCIECEMPIKDVRVVTDSGGHREERVVIETLVKAGDYEQLVEITLTDRENMRFRMLIGRNFLKRGYLVDSAQSFLLGGTKVRPVVSSM